MPERADMTETTREFLTRRIRELASELEVEEHVVLAIKKELDDAKRALVALGSEENVHPPGRSVLYDHPRSATTPLGSEQPQSLTLRHLGADPRLTIKDMILATLEQHNEFKIRGAASAELR